MFILNRGGGTDTTDANATADKILTGYSGYVNEVLIQGTMPDFTKNPVNYSLPANGSYTIPLGYHNGAGKVTQSLATQGATTITPKTTKQTLCPAGRYTTGAQVMAGSAALVAGNIKENVTIFGIKGSFYGTYTRDGTATAAQVLTGYWGYVKDAKVTGNMPNRGAASSTLAVNGSYTIANGFHNGSGKITQSLTTQGGSTVTPGTANKLAIATGRWVTGDVWCAGDADLIPGNIKSGVNIFGVTGTFTG